jgi:EmrB/QacA subfamily drug resistance transporter
MRDARWISLYVVCTGMLMIVLDTTVVNVALPSIARDLGFSQAGLAWVINAYLVAFAGLLLLSGRLGDIFGSKRIFLIGLTLFTAASLACGLSFTAPMLVVARFIQGIGGAMTSAVILAMIATTFEDQGERTRAMGVFSFTASSGGSIGLLVGGAIAQSAGWHWVFLINIPIGIATVAIGSRTIVAVPPAGLSEGADVFGALSITAALMLAIYGVVQIPQDGFSLRVGLCELAALVLFVAFIVRQRLARAPLVPLRLFKTRNIAISNLTNGLVAAALFTFFFLDTLSLRRHGYGSVATGLAFLPFTIAIGAFSLGWAEQITTRFGARRTFIAGIVLATFGMAWLTIATPFGNYLLAVFPPMLILGVGLGIAFPALMIFAMWETGPGDAGIASGIVNTTSEAGGAFGLAVLATAGALWGFTAAFAIATALLVCACGLAFALDDQGIARTTPPSTRSADPEVAEAAGEHT